MFLPNSGGEDSLFFAIPVFIQTVLSIRNVLPSPSLSLKSFSSFQLSCYVLPLEAFPHLAVFFQSYVARSLSELLQPLLCPLMSVLTLCCLERTSLSICLSSQQTNCKQSTGRAMSSLHSQGLAWSLDRGHGSGDAEKGAGVRTGVTGTYICVHAWCLSRGHLLLTLS